MNPYVSLPCSCRAERLSYGTNIVIDEAGGRHTASSCAGKTIVLTPELPRPWRLLDFDCGSESHWVTGPDPEQLLADLGCGCEDVA